MDILANSFAAIKNAQRNKTSTVMVNNSNEMKSILQVLLEEGLIRYFKILDTKFIEVTLKYHSENHEPVMRDIMKVSTSKKAVYINTKSLIEIPWNIVYILSTSKGILSNRKAKTMKVGGKVICLIS